MKSTTPRRSDRNALSRSVKQLERIMTKGITPDQIAKGREYERRLEALRRRWAGMP